jgi:predicted Fe-Mo cluster-binding NifX family protein
MKIAVTAASPSLDATIDPRFGRCPYFLIVETDDMRFEAVANPSLSLGGGAGIQAAQLMAEKGVRHVLTGNCGPNAHQTLSAAGIGVIVGCSGAVRNAITEFAAGRLAATAEPNVADHFGTAAGPASTDSSGSASGPGMGRGGGRGMGRGCGGGRGMGMGGGMGKGGGGGRGMGRGRSTGFAGGLGRSQGPGPSETAERGEDDLVMLKRQAETLKNEMDQIQQRIRDFERNKKGGGNS